MLWLGKGISCEIEGEASDILREVGPLRTADLKEENLRKDEAMVFDGWRLKIAGSSWGRGGTKKNAARDE